MLNIGMAHFNKAQLLERLNRSLKNHLVSSARESTEVSKRRYLNPFIRKFIAGNIDLNRLVESCALMLDEQEIIADRPMTRALQQGYIDAFFSDPKVISWLADIAEALGPMVAESLPRHLKLMPFPHKELFHTYYREQLDKLVEQNQPRDQRVIYSSERKLRRYNSLARYFALTMRSSACCSVTIEGKQLLIATNTNGNMPTHEMATIIQQKQARLKTFIQTSFASNSKQEEAAQTICDEFDSHCTFGGDELKTDLLKIYDACNPSASHKIAFPEDYFSETEKFAMLGESVPPLMLVASTDTTSSASHRGAAGSEDTELGEAVPPLSFVMQTFALTPTGAEKISELPFVFAIPKDTRQNHFHAEQLLIQHLKEVQLLDLSKLDKDNPPFRFGISKLCCHTCKRVMDAFPRVIVHGEHGNAYEGTINLLTGEREEARKPSRITIPIPGPTSSPRSPTHTPEAKALFERCELLPSVPGSERESGADGASASLSALRSTEDSAADEKPDTFFGAPLGRVRSLPESPDEDCYASFFPPGAKARHQEFRERWGSRSSSTVSLLIEDTGDSAAAVASAGAGIDPACS